MPYIDGFIAAVPSSNLETYQQYAGTFGPIFKEYGALRVVECWGDDVPDGEVTSFPLSVQCKEDETVIFSWIEWPSKEVRMEAWKRMEQDKRFHPDENPMPFDGKRMIYGGFKPILDV